MEENNISSGSLNFMHDIVTPDPVSWWPLAPGWYALTLLLLSLLFYLFFVLKEKQEKNLYRREALKRVNKLEDIKNLFELMKVVALHHYGRESVASLTDDAWWDFIESHSTVKSDKALRELSQKVLYNHHVTTSKEDLDKVRNIAKVWIQTHGSKA